MLYTRQDHGRCFTPDRITGDALHQTGSRAARQGRAAAAAAVWCKACSRGAALRGVEPQGTAGQAMGSWEPANRPGPGTRRGAGAGSIGCWGDRSCRVGRGSRDTLPTPARSCRDLKKGNLCLKKGNLCLKKGNLCLKKGNLLGMSGYPGCRGRAGNGGGRDAGGRRGLGETGGGREHAHGGQARTGWSGVEATFYGGRRLILLFGV